MPNVPRLMTITEAADSVDVHPETLRRAIRQLACYRLGGCTRISPEQLNEYLGRENGAEDAGSFVSAIRHFYFTTIW